MRRNASWSGRIALVSGFLCANAVLVSPLRADVYVQTFWGHVGLVEYASTGTAESISGWSIKTSDSDENVQSTNAFLDDTVFPQGLSTPFEFGFTAESLVFGLFENTVSVDEVGGWVATYPANFASPFFGVGDNAYAVGLFDSLGIMRSFFQTRLKDTNAVVIDPSLATQAVNLGLWSSVDDYVEFNRGFAFYDANSASPNGPADFTGFVFPEPSSVGLLAIGATALGLTRRR